MLTGLLGSARKLVLLGTGPSLRHAPFEEADRTWWSVPRLWGEVPRLDVVVEVHTADVVRQAGFDDRLKNIPVPVYVACPLGFAPDERAYPFDDARARFTVAGRTNPPLAGSLDWLMALALLHAPLPVSIELFGFDLHVEDEYFHQRDTAAFWVGMAHALGVRVTLPPTSEILNLPYLYGPQSRELDAVLAQATERMAWFRMRYDQTLYGVSEALVRLPLLPTRQQGELIRQLRTDLSSAMFLQGVAAEAAFRKQRLPQ